MEIAIQQVGAFTGLPGENVGQLEKSHNEHAKEN